MQSICGGFDVEITKEFFENLSLEYAGFFDHDEYEGGILTIGGWSVLFAENNNIANKIYVLFNNEIIAVSNEFNVDRDDVKIAYPDAPLKCGFTVEIDAIFKDKLDFLEIFVESDNFLYSLNKFNGFLSQVELSGKCNLRCPQCPSVMNGFHNQLLSKKDIDLIDPLFKQARSICFDGFGEILLTKEEELNYAFSKIPYSKDLKFHTNGMLINKRIDLILDNALPLRQVIVSIDSLSPDLYPVLRKGGKLPVVLDNVKLLKKAREERGQKFPIIIPNMIILNSNYKEIKDFIDLASTLDNKLELIHLYDLEKMDNEDSDFKYESEKIKHNLKKYKEFLSESLEYAKEKGVEVYFSGSVTSEDEQEDEEYIGEKKELKDCHYKTNGRCLQADGKFMFCVWQTSPIFDWKATNNVDPNKNERAKKVMDLLDNNIIPFECSTAGCPYVYGRESKENKDEKVILVKGGWSATKL